MPLLLKTFPAENRPALCRLEGNRSFLAALGTCRPGFGLRGRLPGNRGSQNSNALRLACFTTFRFVLELFVVEEQLFACGKDKVRAAVDALQYLVLEVHPSPHSPPTSRSLGKAAGLPYARVRAESLRTPPQTVTLGFGPPARSRRSTAERN